MFWVLRMRPRSQTLLRRNIKTQTRLGDQIVTCTMAPALQYRQRRSQTIPRIDAQLRLFDAKLHRRKGFERGVCTLTLSDLAHGT